MNIHFAWQGKDTFGNAKMFDIIPFGVSAIWNTLGPTTFYLYLLCFVIQITIEQEWVKKMGLGFRWRTLFGKG